MAIPSRKPPLQDIVTRPGRTREPRPVPTPPPVDVVTPQQPPEPPRRLPPEAPPFRENIPPRRRRNYFGITSIIVGLVILILGIGAVFVFSGAELTVVPKQANAFIDATVTGVHGATASSTSTSTAVTADSSLPFDVLTLDDSDSKTAPATGEENASVPASGHIVIYNNYSDKPQKLIKNTRFENPEGLVYRIRDSITVPGKSGSTPGSVEAVVYADEAGEKYNIGLTDFTVPGFKGTPQFEGFYARSKTPMTGGFVGMRKTISEADATNLKSQIQDSLRKKLIDGATPKLPKGYIMPEKGVFVTFDEPTQTSDGNNVTLSIHGTLHAFILDEGALAKVIAKKNVASYDDSPVTIKDPAALSVEPVIPETLSDPWNSSTIDFMLKGNVGIEWVIDQKKLAEDLAGKSEEALNTVLTGYPGVERAKAVLRPIWRSTFPKDPSDIKITFEEPEAAE